MRIDAETLRFTLAHPSAPPLDVLPPATAHRYGSVDLIDRSLRLVGNAACTAALRSLTPTVAAFGVGREFYRRGGLASILCPVPAAIAFGVGAGWGMLGAMHSGAQMFVGVAGACVGVAGSMAEFTLDGMSTLTVPPAQPTGPQQAPADDSSALGEEAPLLNGADDAEDSDGEVAAEQAPAIVVGEAAMPADAPAADAERVGENAPPVAGPGHESMRLG